MAKYLFSHFILLAYLLLNAACAAPIIWGGLWLGDQLEHHYYLLALFARGVVCAVVLGILAVSWTTTAFYVQNDYSFFRCFAISWLSLWNMLPTLPVIRHWFGHDDETIPRPKDETEEAEE